MTHNIAASPHAARFFDFIGGNAEHRALVTDTRREELLARADFVPADFAITTIYKRSATEVSGPRCQVSGNSGTGFSMT
jgi:hypothetical protein